MRLEREPYLAESRYRDKLASGRIRPKDVEALLVEQLGASAAEDVAGVGSRLDLWRAVVLHGIPAAAGRELSWILEETEALARFRTDLPASARSAATAVREMTDRVDDERQAVRRLWNACLEAVRRADPRPFRARDAGSPSRLAAGGARHRHRPGSIAAHSIPGGISRSGPGALVHARTTSGFTAAFWRSTARRWRRTAAAGRERSPPCRRRPHGSTERGRLDRTFSRSARCR